MLGLYGGVRSTSVMMTGNLIVHSNGAHKWCLWIVCGNSMAIADCTAPQYALYRTDHSYYRVHEPSTHGVESYFRTTLN